TSKDERTKTRHKGWFKKGTRAFHKAVFVCGQHITGTEALSLDGMIVATVCEESITRKKFLQFMEGTVVCLLPTIS
ncbi:hypothetical protein BT96DRAFT_837473, partial [Gymnopus androsaceus JB14]